MLKRQKQAGDTLIEVIFAVTIFSMVVVAALAIMNQGSSASQRSLEITLATQQIENQAETLRFLHEAYVTNYQKGYSSTNNLNVEGSAGEYYKIVHKIDPNVTQATAFGGASCPARPSTSFILNTRTATVANSNVTQLVNAATYPQVRYQNETSTLFQDAQGIWIEGVKSRPNAQLAGYIDFHIRACWSAPGMSMPTTLGTIVRLYEPRV